jgi:hypothetical protein
MEDKHSLCARLNPRQDWHRSALPPSQSKSSEYLIPVDIVLFYLTNLNATETGIETQNIIHDALKTVWERALWQLIFGSWTGQLMPFHRLAHISHTGNRLPNCVLHVTPVNRLSLTNFFILLARKSENSLRVICPCYRIKFIPWVSMVVNGPSHDGK